MSQEKQTLAATRWIRLGAGLAAFVLVLGAGIHLLLRKPLPARAAPIGARLELVAGEVTVDGGDGPLRVVSGTPLLTDVKLSTGKGARALVRLPDGSRLFLRDSSGVRLGPDAVRLERGEYWLDAPPVDRKPLVHESGDVSVAAADAGLSIRRDGGLGVIYVARGMAIVTGKAGRVEVKAGEQATIQGGAAPRVAAVAFWDDWTGGMADLDAGGRMAGASSGTIYGVDEGAPRGSPARRLELGRQAVRAVVREGLSETEVDQTFFNPGERAVEGWYWFTVPERASVTGFALETNGQLVAGEMIESKEAMAQYGAAKASGHSPAILEWVDSRTYRARIYPIPAGGNRRVVLRYLELRPIVDNQLEYVYPMAARDPVRIGEFSLSVDLGDAGKAMKIATLADARVEDGGKKVTVRRSGYTPRADFQLTARIPDRRPPFTVARYRSGGDSADYVLGRYTPDVDWKSLPAERGDVVVVVDTSAAGDDTSRQLKAATAEAILRALSDSDRFALVSLDSKPTVLHPPGGLAPASGKEIARALEALADHAAGGATDLGALFDVALGRLHGTEQPAVIYVGDGVATSGELSGEQLAERLRRAFATSRARLFTVGVGTDANLSLLAELARAGGGASFRVNEPEATTARALELTAALKAPTITELDIDLGAGLDEPFVTASGKVSRGSEVMLLARTHHDLPREVKIRGRIGGTAFEKTYPMVNDETMLQAFVPRLWAAEYVRRLLGSSGGVDAERGRIVALGLDYGLMTPYTSLLALESEAAYQEMGIPRRASKLRGERLTALDRMDEWRVLSRLNAPPPTPAWAMGCSKREKAAPASESVAMVERTVTKPVASPTEEATPPSRALDQEPASAEPVTRGRMAAKGGAAVPPKPAAAPDDAFEGSGRGVGDLPEAKNNALESAVRRRGNAPGFDPLADVREIKKKATGAPAGRRDGTKDKREVPSAPSAAPASVLVEATTCSDIAGRPLAERALFWKKRLRTAKTPSELVERYDTAKRSCELGDWRAESAFLELLDKRVDSEAAVRIVLDRFADRPEVQKYLAKLILRRAVDQRLAAAVESVLFGSAVKWPDVDRKLSEVEKIDDRIAKLREFVARAPDDPNGTMRLVRLLVQADRKDEAVALGRRLRDQGFMTPLVARAIGDALAQAGLDAEAVRTYSEIVEFDPDNLESRRLLGDIYLGHAWYDPAYRQYRTLTESAAADALGWLRLAAAAAGTGRVDEALRIERHVASAEGTPGPRDPRRWARLASAARLARLIDKPPAAAPGQDALKRQLKELQLFSGPGTLVLLTWEDLSSDLLLVSRQGNKDVGLGETTDAAPAGLSAVLLPTADAAQTSRMARLRSVPAERPLKLRRQDIVWDGKDFRVTVAELELPARATEVAM
jgi:tetratricopeptide (TPR) repeat protein